MPKATHPKTRFECETEPGKIKIDKWLKVYDRYYLPQRNEHNSRRHFLSKIKKHRNTGWPLGEIDRIKKNCVLPDFSTEKFIAKFIASITDKKLRDVLVDRNVPKTTGEIEQNTYQRRNWENTILEALLTTRVKEIIEKPIHKKHTLENKKRDQKKDRKN